MDSVATLTGVPNTELNKKINSLEKENVDLKKAIDDLRNLVISLQARVETIESNSSTSVAAPKVTGSQQLLLSLHLQNTWYTF